jgi:hypothetical protein
MTTTGVWWRSGPGRGRFPLPCGERCTIGTGVAASPAVAFASGKAIISVTGRVGGRPRSQISRCFAGGIIGLCTRRVIRSRAGLTGCCDSGGRMVGLCLRCRRLPRCRRSPLRRSGRCMNRTAFASTRGRRARAGSESAWMWGGPSMSCTRAPRDPNHPRHIERDSLGPLILAGSADASRSGSGHQYEGLAAPRLIICPSSRWHCATSALRDSATRPSQSRSRPDDREETAERDEEVAHASPIRPAAPRRRGRLLARRR